MVQLRDSASAWSSWADQLRYNPETAPVQEVPELTTYGTSPDTAPIYENSELELTTNDEVRIERLIFIEEQYTDEIPEGVVK